MRSPPPAGPRCAAGLRFAPIAGIYGQLLPIGPAPTAIGIRSCHASTLRSGRASVAARLREQLRIRLIKPRPAVAETARQERNACHVDFASTFRDQRSRLSTRAAIGAA